MSEDKKNRYFDRELSWIDFNTRVLAESEDTANPLLERLKFTGIVSSNFDEFFMVRAASLAESDPILREVYTHAFQLSDRQTQGFEKSLALELEKAGISRVSPAKLTERQREYLNTLLHQELMPLLTPIAVRGDETLGSLVNMSLYRVFQLIDPKAPGALHHAVVEIPKSYSRIISLGSESGYAFILLEDVVSLFAGELFPGYQIVQQGSLRITRAAELSLDEEKDEDFAKMMSEALRTRRASFITRLEISAADDLVSFVKSRLKIPDYKIYRAGAWIDLKSVSQLAFQPMFENLKRPAWTPQPLRDFEETDDLWTLLKTRDVAVHHPYESFDAFLHFLGEAARDPDVLAIKQTLYRAAHPSAVVSCLERALENGKQVTVLVELKARFDEQRNIEWARRLVNAGATVLYGVAGLKTHAKVCLVVRREIEGIKRYLHLSTGNYNEKTARLYTDVGLFTSDDALSADAAAFFNVITGYSHPVGFSKIEIAPYGMRKKIERLILRESMRTNKERPGMILAKMNSLVDQETIDALYHASQAGVQIKLNVRGVCRLRPGVKGLSETIEVVSIVDMFLEHSRMFYFLNDGDEELYLSSADWMPRNFDRRLELLFPIEDKKIKKNLTDLLKLYFKDNVKAWRLGADGVWSKIEAEKEKRFRVQEYLCRKTLQSAENSPKTVVVRELKPQKPKDEAPDQLRNQPRRTPSSHRDIRIIPPS